MISGRRVRRMLPVLFLAIGVGLMIPFDAALTRVLGMVCLVAFVATGVFGVANPAFLAGDDD
jgi:pyridoxal biosynthesis lyase PdxS